MLTAGRLAVAGPGVVRASALVVIGLGVLGHVTGRLAFADLDLGPTTALPPRFLRLGGVAVMALPLMTLLLSALRTPVSSRALSSEGSLSEGQERLVGIGERLALVSAVLMPSILTVAALTTSTLKYLLPVPALSATAAAGLGLWVAWGQRRRLAALGWLSLFATFQLGLCVGMFAFDGPLDAPAFIGDYTAPVRTALRQLHVGTAVGGLFVLSVAWLVEKARTR